jgi:hypothetical protein
VVPEDDALDIPVGINVTIIFSEPLQAGTVTGSTVVLRRPDGTSVEADVGLGPDGITVTIDPDAPLAFSTIYTVEVTSGVLDLDGAPAIVFSSQFRTECDPADQDCVPLPDGTPLASVADQTTLPPGPLAAGRRGVEGNLAVGPNLGFSVADAGLLQDDTLADFLGGAPGADVTDAGGDGTEAGAVIVALGSADQTEREQPDVVFTGELEHDRAGSAVVGAFHFDNDPRPDILIGAEQVNRTDPDPSNHVATGAGRIYLIYFDPNDYDLANPLDCTGPSPNCVDLGRVGNSGHLEGEIPGVVFVGESIGDQAGFALARDPPGRRGWRPDGRPGRRVRGQLGRATG